MRSSLSIELLQVGSGACSDRQPRAAIPEITFRSKERCVISPRNEGASQRVGLHGNYNGEVKRSDTPMGMFSGNTSYLHCIKAKRKDSIKISVNNISVPLFCRIKSPRYILDNIWLRGGRWGKGWGVGGVINDLMSQ